MRRRKRFMRITMGEVTEREMELELTGSYCVIVSVNGMIPGV
jgi:hypothetical protein